MSWRGRGIGESAVEKVPWPNEGTKITIINCNVQKCWTMWSDKLQFLIYHCCDSRDPIESTVLELISEMEKINCLEIFEFNNFNSNIAAEGI